MQVAGHNVAKKKIELGPYNYYSKMSRWEHANLYPLHIILDSFQVVRLMLLTGNYCFSYKWASASSYHGAPTATLQSMRMIDFHFRNSSNIDYFDVVTVMTGNKYGPDTDAGQRMQDRKQVFDTIFVQQAVAMSRHLDHAVHFNREVHDLPITTDDIPTLEPMDGVADGVDNVAAVSDNGTDSDSGGAASVPEADM